MSKWEHGNIPPAQVCRQFFIECTTQVMQVGSLGKRIWVDLNNGPYQYKVPVWSPHRQSPQQGYMQAFIDQPVESYAWEGDGGLIVGF